MLMRYRMHKLIRLLEKDDSAGFNAAISSDVYLKALRALDDEGCIKAVKDWNGTYVRVWLLDHYATYQLSRQDVWKNRIGGFIAGVVSGVIISVVSAIITGLLPGL